MPTPPIISRRKTASPRSTWTVRLWANSIPRTSSTTCWNTARWTTPDYEAPKDVMETAQEIRDFVRNGKPLPDHFDMKHAYAAAKAYAGMTLAEFDAYVKAYAAQLAEFDAYVKAYAAQPANGFSGMTYGESFYKPMLEVFDYLKGNGFTCYVVSGSDRFICRALTESIGIPSNSSSRT